MNIQRIHIKNFRCFKDFSIDLDSPILLISGLNGAGKSSLLEALHYSCYLRSFRTHLPRELIHFDSKAFHIKIGVKGIHEGIDYEHTIAVGFSGNKRLVKVDQKSIQSYKELIDFYRVVTLTEDDITLIQGSPEVRRLFLDQALTLYDPEYVNYARKFRNILEQRNALLHKGSTDHELYMVWTQQLWDQTKLIHSYRMPLLSALERRINLLLATWFQQDLSIELRYIPKKIEDNQSFQDFYTKNFGLQQLELRFGRSFFGAHLDDFEINFCQKRSKAYASRGQQKLVAILLKVAHMQEVLEKKGAAILLLDDFMADFDSEKGTILIQLLADLGCQLIFTSPQESAHFEQSILSITGSKQVKLTN